MLADPIRLASPGEDYPDPLPAIEPIYAEIPERLRDADELLTRYGIWATTGRRGGRQCGSAEGDYRSGNRWSEPGAPVLGLDVKSAMRCQRALQAVATLERQVLAIIYVPNRVPAHLVLQRLGIPPRLSRERHFNGLVMFRNLHGGG